MNRILVVIVTYNAMKWLSNCLGSLIESTSNPDVFVVDNGSQDGTQSFIQQNFPDVNLIQNKENLGFGKANNIGIQYAIDHDYDYVYLLNQDAWIMPETLEKLIDISMRNPDYGILSPFQMNADLIHLDRIFGKYICSWDSNPNILNDFFNKKSQEIYCVKDVMAAHWFVTRNCFLKVGGFSPSFPHYAEDTNYTERVRFWGMKVGIVPSLRVVHDRAKRKNSVEKKMYQSYSQSIRLLSQPEMEGFLIYFKIVYRFLRKTIERRSLMPLFYCIKLFGNIRTIRRNRVISMQNRCAFLKEKEIKK